MTRIAVGPFLAEVPRQEPRNLPDKFASASVNVDTSRGLVEPHRKITTTYTSLTDAIQTIYHLERGGNTYWLTWPRVVDVARSPIAQDSQGRLYFTGDDNWRADREKTFGLATQWWFRNPFHNLFFYVIGVADRERTVYSFGEWGSPGWSFHVVNWKFLYLPFISYSGKVDFYIGWRPYGAFGAKLKNGDR